MNIAKKYRNSHLHFLFNLKDERALGRSVMLGSSILSSLIGVLTGGVFYTSFLMQNGINLVNIGIITFIPYIANLFSVFSPSILERFDKRRSVLAISRTVYYVLQILGITLLPMLVHDSQLKIVLFVIIIFAANAINALFGSGYTAWHLNFIPPEVRAEYYPTVSTIQSTVVQILSLLFAIVADAFTASQYGAIIITALRYVAFALGMLDVWILTRPVEYPYENSGEKPSFRDIITLPLAHKKFLLMMAIMFVYNFVANMPVSVLNYYLLNDVGVQYSLIEGVNICYPICMILFLKHWKRFLKRFGWVETFMTSNIFVIPTIIAYSCVTHANYLWLYPALRLCQHLLMMGANVTWTNLIYLHMPQERQTNYIAFYTIISNIAIFLGMLFSTTFVGMFPDLGIRIGSITFGNVQVILWVQALLYVAMVVLCMFSLRYLRRHADA